MVSICQISVRDLANIRQGGSVVVKACPAIQRDIAPVVGVCNLDVVEGGYVSLLSIVAHVESLNRNGNGGSQQYDGNYRITANRLR